MIPHRSNDHIQNRSSGRSNSVSIVTLKTPSWPTTIAPRAVVARLAVAARPARGELRTTRRRPSPARGRGQAVADALGDLGEGLAAGGPDLGRPLPPTARSRRIVW